MNATTAPQSPSNVSAEDAARADLVLIRAKAHGTFAKPSNITHRFCECCGSDVIEQDGTYWTGQGGQFPRMKPLDREGVMKMLREKIHPRAFYSEAQGYTDPLYKALLDASFKAYSRGNRTGAILGKGLRKDELINMYYEPSHELYGKIEGLEFDDPHDGLCSLIWTNA